MGNSSRYFHLPTFFLKTLFLAGLLALPFAGQAFAGFTSTNAPHAGALPEDNPPLPASSTTTASQMNSMDSLNDDAKLRAGDVISYRVIQERRDTPVQLTVSDSGELNIPLLGRYYVQGKTCKKVAQEIKPLLEKEYFYHATVIVGLDNMSTRSPGRVYLTGQVRSIGAINLPPNDSLTLSKAILLNGGLADFANKRKVKLIRKKQGGGTTVEIVDLVEILEKGHTDKDPVLQPDDTINVPEKLINF